MHGRAFLGKYNTEERRYVFGARNRMDEQIDKQGYVRDTEFRYIRNYMPEQPNYMPVQYRLQMPMMRRMLKLKDQGGLNGIQMLWFKAPREKEEFYDVVNDPDEVHNLICNPAYKQEIDRLKNAYDQWDNEYNALWKLPETESRKIFFPDGKQQVVSTPEIEQTAEGIVLHCDTPGVSFAYQINGKGYSAGHWFLYSTPIRVKKDDVVNVIGVRAGFRNSEEAKYVCK